MGSAGPRARAARASRMLQLATWALREAGDPCTEPPPLLLALPEAREGVRDHVGPGFLADLQAQTGVAVDEGASRIYRHGGAGGLLALRDAVELISAGRHPLVMIGGIDSFVDRDRLELLDEEGRLLGASPDGFVPGEAAAFLVVGAPAAAKRLGLAPLARISGVAVGVERGHRYSEEPHRGDGLADTFRALFDASPAAPRVRCVYAGLNCEGFSAKEWGVACLRNSGRFEEGFRVEHPADCIGETGAAMGPALLVLAALGVNEGYRESPVLAWSTSDREARAAALVEAASNPREVA